MIRCCLYKEFFLLKLWLPRKYSSLLLSVLEWRIWTWNMLMPDPRWALLSSASLTMTALSSAQYRARLQLTDSQSNVSEVWNRSWLETGMMIADGWDKHEGGKVYRVVLEGAIMNWAASCNWSYLYGFLDHARNLASGISGSCKELSFKN